MSYMNCTEWTLTHETYRAGAGSETVHRVTERHHDGTPDRNEVTYSEAFESRADALAALLSLIAPMRPEVREAALAEAQAPDWPSG
jgi:hypothetical protein